MTKPQGLDPRLNLAPDALEEASQLAMPAVAQKGGMGDMGLAVGLIGCVGLGVFTLLFMNNQRTAPNPAPVPIEQPVIQPPPTTTLPPIDPTIRPADGFMGGGEIPQPVAPIVQPVAPAPQPNPQADANARSPALIIDLSTPTQAEGNQAAPAQNGGILSKNDSFASKFNSDVSQLASKIGQPSQVVSQGTVIPAVLETAINSDLPGFTRAVVTRDVRSFDGTRVLIPRGSRLIGQYKSGLATGETRAFIIWNRLIRPDGMSIQIASPAIDNLGQAGMTGRVDTHFVKRFGASFLLSIVSGLTTSNTKGGNTIVIGTAAGAKNIIEDALNADSNIPPTIKVKQGSTIMVFAARDLDFAAAGDGR